jgi:hypothetical protein
MLSPVKSHRSSSRSRRHRRTDRKVGLARGAKTPGGLALFAERTRPGASETPKGTHGTPPRWSPGRSPREEEAGSRFHRGGREALEGMKPGEDRAPIAGNPGGHGSRASGGIKTGKPGEVVRERNRSTVRANGMPAEAASKDAADPREEKPPTGETPGALPVRKVRRVAGGAKRQEGAKPWRRTGGTRQPPPWTPAASCAEGERNPMGVVVLREDTTAVPAIL